MFFRLSKTHLCFAQNKISMKREEADIYPLLQEVSAICQVCLLFGKLAFRAQHELGVIPKGNEMLSGNQNIRVTP